MKNPSLGLSENFKKNPQQVSNFTKRSSYPKEKIDPNRLSALDDYANQSDACEKLRTLIKRNAERLKSKEPEESYELFGLVAFF